MALGINVKYFCIHIQNGLAKSLNKRITCLIDHYHRIAVNIMLASYGLTHHKLNSNSYNCNQNGTPRCSKYVESWPQPNISHLRVGYILWQNHLNYPGSSAQGITIKATLVQTHFKRNNSWSVG